MGWTAPHTFAVGDPLTSPQMNAIGANLNFLKSGVFAFAFTNSNSAQTVGTNELVIASVTQTFDGTTAVEIDYWWANIVKTVANDQFNVLLYDGATAGAGTLLTGGQVSNASGTAPGSGYIRTVQTPSAGSHTFTARLARNSGTGTAQLFGVGGYNSTITCRQIG